MTLSPRKRVNRKQVNYDREFSELLQLIGSKVRQLRVANGYTSHADFAEAHGLPQIQYWRIEKGRCNMTLKSLNKVLIIHQLNLQEFLTNLHSKTVEQA